MSVRWLKPLGFTALGVCVLAAGASTAALGARTAPRALLRNSTPSWAQKASVGRPAARSSVKVRVYLAPRGGEAAVEAAVTAVSTPGSAQYRQFMTPAQYRARFEPTARRVSNVSAWLRSSGMRVTGVERYRRFITARGTVAQAQRAFATQLRLYRHGGSVVRAPASNISVPRGLSHAVLGVTGLDTAPQLMKPAGLTPPPPGFENGRPCSIFYGQLVAKFQADFQTPLPKFHGAYRDFSPCGYVPAQFRAAYGVDASGLSGSDVKVGIVDAYAASTMEKDANTYARRQGDPQFAAGQYDQVVSSSFTHQSLCDPGGWAGEETLDVEAVHGMAPSAGVVYYGAKSCENSDILAALAKTVDQNRVSIVTNSYGDVEEAQTTGAIRAQEQVVLQGELQGMTFTFSSGDNGDEVLNTGLRQADYPASDPWVTAVGGTTTAIGPSGSIDWQTGWGTVKYSLSADGKSWDPVGFLYGSGGGFSALFPRPSYQNGVAGAEGTRGVPDVAMDGDVTTGMLVGETQAFPNGVRYGQYRVGGTSLSSPLFAGMVALASQNAGGRVGFLNPTIYGQVRSHAGTFDDVLPVHTGDANVRVDNANGVNPVDGLLYSIRTFNNDTSLHVTPGWDDVTGVGSPNLNFLLSLGK
jgi:subtilase family serine protease